MDILNKVIPHPHMRLTPSSRLELLVAGNPTEAELRAEIARDLAEKWEERRFWREEAQDLLDRCVHCDECAEPVLAPGPVESCRRHS